MANINDKCDEKYGENYDDKQDEKKSEQQEIIRPWAGWKSLELTRHTYVVRPQLLLYFHHIVSPFNPTKYMVKIFLRYYKSTRHTYVCPHSIRQNIKENFLKYVLQIPTCTIRKCFLSITEDARVDIVLRSCQGGAIQLPVVIEGGSE